MQENENNFNYDFDVTEPYSPESYSLFLERCRILTAVSRRYKQLIGHVTLSGRVHYLNWIDSEKENDMYSVQLYIRVRCTMYVTPSGVPTEILKSTY